MGFVAGPDSFPAPPPSVNAWDKPLELQSPVSTTPSLISDALMCSVQGAGAAVTEERDSGVDVSDMPSVSTASSLRSSPSSDEKVRIS